jgi:UDP-GlcNAc:undecaprenyl-phosphate GlcNAc-1-phosphate transferase
MTNQHLSCYRVLAGQTSSKQQVKTYISVYLGATILTIIITPVIIRVARQFNIVDNPGIRKVHSRPVPRIGGVAIFASMIGIVIPVLFLPNIIGDSFRLIQSKIFILLLAAGFIFFVGLLDDIKGLRVRTKLWGQLAAAIMICSVGIRVETIDITDKLVFNFGWFSWPLTILWVVGITNAVNLSDGLDGLAAGISAIACGVIALLAICNGQTIMAMLMLALLGSLTGFLFFNFDPAKVFMGDSGSLFLGFTIASSSVLCATKIETVAGLALPILALGLPILDTLFSMLRRFLERRSLFAPDRGHFHHRLLDLGLHQRQAVITAYLVTLGATGLGMFMLYTRNAQTFIVFIGILVLLLLLFRVVGSVQLHKAISDLKQKHAISDQTKRERESFEILQLHFRQARTFDQWWQAICFAADKMGFVRGLLPIVNRDGSKRTLTWENKELTVEAGDLVNMVLPVRDRRARSNLSLEVRIQTNGSLESAGHRIALFGRLLEQYSIANLVG